MKTLILFRQAIVLGSAALMQLSALAQAQQAYLKASNTDPGDYFGWAVSVSGDVAAVSAYWEASEASGVNGDQFNNSAKGTGAVYVFARYGTNWSQQAYLKPSNTAWSLGVLGDLGYQNFGYSVSVSGDTVVVGADNERSGATGVNGDQTDTSADGAGAVYVFVRNGTNWTQQAYLKASNTQAGQGFGAAVSLSGDTLVVGAPGESSSATGVGGDQSDTSFPRAGAAYVFVRDGTNWSQHAYLKASNTDPGDGFGYPLAISGDTIVAGAMEEASNATGVNGDQTDNSATNSGAAYVFVRNGTNWSQQAYLKASDTASYAQFGWSVAASSNTVVIGGHLRGESGSAYVFVTDGTNWFQQAHLTTAGWSVGISGDTLVTGDGYNYEAAYVFTRIGTNWNQQAVLAPSNTNVVWDAFGRPVAISGDTLLVGALADSSNATGVNGDSFNTSDPQSGAAYVFTGVGVINPRLRISISPTTVQLSWPNNATGFVLQSASTLLNGGDWRDMNTTPVQTNDLNTVIISNTAPQSFFRLRGR